jgi:hypothetical protein
MTPEPNHVAYEEDERRLIEGVRLVCALASTPDLVAEHTGDVTLGGGRELPAAEAFAMLRTVETAGEYVRRVVNPTSTPLGLQAWGRLVTPRPWSCLRQGATPIGGSTCSCTPIGGSTCSCTCWVDQIYTPRTPVPGWYIPTI